MRLYLNETDLFLLSVTTYRTTMMYSDMDLRSKYKNSNLTVNWLRNESEFRDMNRIKTGCLIVKSEHMSILKICRHARMYKYIKIKEASSHQLS